MTHTSTEFFKSTKRTIEFLEKHLSNEYSFKFVNAHSVGKEQTATTLKNNASHRTRSETDSAGGGDIEIFSKLKNQKRVIRCKPYIATQYDGKYTINYNIPLHVNTLEKAYHFLELNEIHFLIVRKKGPSITFALFKASDLPISAYILKNRGLGRTTPDRIELLSEYHNKRFKPLHYFNSLIKKYLHETKNRSIATCT